MPFAKYDLDAITGDAEKLNKFMETYGIRRPRPENCPRCQDRLSSKPTLHRGVLKCRCVMEGCQKWMGPETDGILEGSHLSPAHFLDFLFWWAHDCAGTRACDMLGLGNKTVAALS